MEVDIYVNKLNRKVIQMQRTSLPMGKAIVIETCTCAPYTGDHCDDVTTELLVRPLTHTFYDDIAIS